MFHLCLLLPYLFPPLIVYLQKQNKRIVSVCTAAGQTCDPCPSQFLNMELIQQIDECLQLLLLACQLNHDRIKCHIHNSRAEYIRNGNDLLTLLCCDAYLDQNQLPADRLIQRQHLDIHHIHQLGQLLFQLGAALVGVLDIINEHGIALSFDQVGISNGKTGLPVFIAMRDIAETCDTFEKAENYIRNMPEGMPFCIGVSDAKNGTMAVFEREFNDSKVFKRLPVNGILTAPTNNALWRNVPILRYLKDELGIDGCFENDANCGALAEWYFGAGRGCTDFIYLTMSTGIGGGIIAAGRLVRGNGTTLSAGELGHICVELNGRQCNCGMKGCYEAYAGGRALAQRMQEELRDKPDSMIMQLVGGDVEKIDMVPFEKAVRAGDPYAVALWDEMSLRNAQAFGMYINIFNPQRLVLGTLAWAVGDLYTDPIRKYLPRFCWAAPLAACEIVPSELRRDIGYYAGVAAALNYLKEQGR